MSEETISALEKETASWTSEVKQILFDIRAFCMEMDSPLRGKPKMDLDELEQRLDTVWVAAAA
jgi:hypothetical protein